MCQHITFMCPVSLHTNIYNFPKQHKWFIIVMAKNSELCEVKLRVIYNCDKSQASKR